MPKFIYIGTPHIHTTATLKHQQQHLKAAIGAAALGKVPEPGPEKYELLHRISTELRQRAAA